MLTNLSGKKKMNVREGNTGILYFSNNNGYRERYIPDCDLDKAGELLIEFQELKEKRGKYIKDIYWDEGFNWFPTGTNDLFSTVFFPYIKYKPIVDKVLNQLYPYFIGASLIIAFIVICIFVILCLNLKICYG